MLVNFIKRKSLRISVRNNRPFKRIGGNFKDSWSEYFNFKEEKMILFAF